MPNVLIVVDMQNDFICGSLGTKEAAAVLTKVKDLVAGFQGDVIFTRDTHEQNYLSTYEGSMLPVEHCIKGTEGWQIHPVLQPYAVGKQVFDKPGFGSMELANYVAEHYAEQEITLAGVCTDICVVSNALLLKAVLPEASIRVDASCCAGTSPEMHQKALEVLRSCHIVLVNHQ